MEEKKGWMGKEKWIVTYICKIYTYLYCNTSKKSYKITDKLTTRKKYDSVIEG